MADLSVIRYRAFLSYSHADKACAAWLHRALESYRVPSKLVGAVTDVGPVPRRLHPIFRDREELPASGQLGAQLEAALAAAMFLIVVASPAAAQSRWVNEEIRVFKRAHGNDRVLAVIADGEPFASTMPGRASEECFPEALRFEVAADGTITDRPMEPIAADLRPGGEGRQVARLKLVAGLLGLCLDDLVRREAQARMRRLTALASAASIVAVAMTGLTLVAVDARGVAEQRRDQAEGLVEFMLGDLRNKLEPVGRLEVLDGVGERALAYYRAQRAGDLDADALGRRSRALHLIGEVRDLRGDSEGGLATFRQAAATTAELLKRYPDNGQRIFDHAQSVFWVGYIAWQRGDRATAERSFQQYRQLAERLAPMDRNNLAWQAEPAYAYSNLGTLWFEEGKAPQAGEAFARALAIRSAIARRVPADSKIQIAVAQSHAWLADTQTKMGRFDLALQHRTAEGAIYRHLLDADSRNNEVKQSLVVNYNELGKLALYDGQVSKAIAHAQSAVALSRQLTISDPNNKLWSELAAGARRDEAESLIYAGRPTAAAAGRDAVALARELVRTDSTNIKWQGDYLARAELVNAMAPGEPATQKLVALQDVTARLERLHGQAPDNRKLMWLLAWSYLSEGDNLAAVHRLQEARLKWQASVATLKPATDPEPRISAVEAAALSRLGRRDEARAILDALDRQNYRHPLVLATRAGLRTPQKEKVRLASM